MSWNIHSSEQICTGKKSTSTFWQEWRIMKHLNSKRFSSIFASTIQIERRRERNRTQSNNTKTCSLEQTDLHCYIGKTLPLHSKNGVIFKKKFFPCLDWEGKQEKFTKYSIHRIFHKFQTGHYFRINQTNQSIHELKCPLEKTDLESRNGEIWREKRKNPSKITFSYFFSPFLTKVLNPNEWFSKKSFLFLRIKSLNRKGLEMFIKENRSRIKKFTVAFQD